MFSLHLLITLTEGLLAEYLFRGRGHGLGLGQRPRLLERAFRSVLEYRLPLLADLVVANLRELGARRKQEVREAGPAEGLAQGPLNYVVPVVVLYQHYSYLIMINLPDSLSEVLSSVMNSWKVASSAHSRHFSMTGDEYLWMLIEYILLLIASKIGLHSPASQVCHHR